jgi:Mn-dependent DtxR family transcriptional regulator
MATSTVEDYLKAILLEEHRDPDSLVTTGRIAAAIQVAACA